MTALRTFLLSFCTVCAVTGAVHLLAPGKAMRKPVRQILSLVTLAALVTAAAGLGGSLPGWTVPQTPETTSESLLESAARLSFETALTAEGVSFREIEVFTDKSSDGSIHITKVIIQTDSSAEDVERVIGGGREYEVIIRNE